MSRRALLLTPAAAALVARQTGLSRLDPQCDDGGNGNGNGIPWGVVIGGAAVLGGATTWAFSRTELGMDVAARITGQSKYTPFFLHLAAHSGDEAEVDKMLAKGVDPAVRAADGSTPLIFAAMNGHASIAAKLVDKEADMVAKSKQPDRALAMMQSVNHALIAAAHNGHCDIVEHLLGVGGDVAAAMPDDGSTALHMASVNGHIDVVKLLAGSPKIDLNVRNDKGDAPIMYASAMGRTETIQALVQVRGWNLLTPRAPLGAIVLPVGDGAVPVLLLSHQAPGAIVRVWWWVHVCAQGGADPKFTNPQGITPLHLAAMNGHAGTCAVLLEVRLRSDAVFFSIMCALT